MATAEVSNKVQETRHSNVGKALHNVLLPQLRSYINAKLEAFFQELVNEYNINDANSNTLANPKAKGKPAFWSILKWILMYLVL